MTIKDIFDKMSQKYIDFGDKYNKDMEKLYTQFYDSESWKCLQHSVEMKKVCYKIAKYIKERKISRACSLLYKNHELIDAVGEDEYNLLTGIHSYANTLEI